MEFSTLAVEELAGEYPDELETMRSLAALGSNCMSVTLELADGHAWKVSRALGLSSVEFMCPGPEPHTPTCVPPEPMSEKDIAFLDGNLFDES